MKTNHILSILLLLSIAVFYSSCHPVLYSSVGQNVPMLQQKGEAALHVGYSESYGEGSYIANETDGKGLAIQTAYAIDSSLALMGSFYSMKNLSSPGPEDWISKGSYGEIGFGKFGGNKNHLISYEAFAGLGYGSIANTLGSEHVDVKFWKPFVQPSIGYTTKYFDAIATLRMGLVSYSSESYSLTDPTYQQDTQTYFDQNKTTFVFEPGITLRGGFENFKIQVQYAYTSFEADNKDIAPVNKDFISIGAFFLISNRYK